MLATLPWWLLTAVIVGAMVSVAVGLHIVVHRSFPKTDFIVHNEVAGFIVAVVGALYATLLGFLTIVVWQHADDAANRALQEASAARDIWRTAAMLRPPDEHRVRDAVVRYADVNVVHEWPMMARGMSSGQGTDELEEVLDDVAALPITSLRDVAVVGTLMERSRELDALRAHRLDDNRTALPPVLWAALILGAVVVIGFEYLFGSKNFRVQLLMTAGTAIMIGLAFSVILKLDQPFRGDATIAATPWMELQSKMEAPTNGR
jgi:hypothetical protein